MTNPEDTKQDTELLGLGSSNNEPTGEVGQEPQDAELDSASLSTEADEATATIDEGEWQEAADADYQERMRDFDEVDSTPVVSLPVQSSQGDDSELKMPSAGDQSR
jgi:hypothetical protein